MSRLSQSKNGRPAIPCPQWLRVFKNRFTILWCRTCFWATGRPNSKSLHFKMTRGQKWSTTWPKLMPPWSYDVTWNQCIQTSADIGCINSKWRHRVNDGSTKVMLLTIVTPGHLDMLDLISDGPVAQKHVLHLYMVKWSLMPLTIVGKGLLGAHFLIGPAWTPQELDKMRQIGVIRTQIECPSTPWA